MHGSNALPDRRKEVAIMSSKSVRVLVPPTTVPGRGAEWAATFALWVARRFAAPRVRSRESSLRAAT
jgi:hypothetical protein